MQKQIPKDAVTGIYRAVADKGFGFVTPLGGEQADLFVPPGGSGGAWHGDTVSAAVADGTECRVVSVLSRNTREVVGRLCVKHGSAWVAPDDRRLPGRIVLPRGVPRGVSDGDKAAVRITSHGQGNAKEAPCGEWIAALGRDGTFEAAVEAVLYKHGVHREFPPRVKQAAGKTPRAVPPESLNGREDLRGQLVFTIDGEHAKDLDDAVSLTYDDAGRRVLGVHIADVSHYVRIGSAPDAEAWSRGTSVYFADQVVPMLPVELSNGICSLGEGVDRLCVSCFMTLGPNGSTVGSELKLTVIRSAARMTYGGCNAILEGDSDLREKYGFLTQTLTDMNALSKQMQKLRRAGGALSIDVPEGEVVCGADGRPEDVRVRERGDSEMLIEAFMLAANEAVANQLFWSERPCVYRVHPAPDEGKLDVFYALASLNGLKVKRTKAVSGGPLQDILDSAKGMQCSRVIHGTLLRGLMKALYSAQNTGHFGLASDCYCHFTSPIRRYPDLTVHRCIKQHMGWEEQSGGMKGRCAEAAEQSSERELAAVAAERETEKLYKALYMKRFEGDVFEGIISGVHTYGFFVELPNTVEGLVPVHTLSGDIYEPDETRLKLTGQTTGVTYAVGDAVTVTCEFADPLTGRVDFGLRN